VLPQCKAPTTPDLLVTCDCDPQALGCVAVRYFARLMPLLLGWLHTRGRATRAGALAALETLVKTCWPRMPAHAGLLWQHLQALCCSAPIDELQITTKYSGVRTVETFCCPSRILVVRRLTPSCLLLFCIAFAWAMLSQHPAVLLAAI